MSEKPESTERAVSLASDLGGIGAGTGDTARECTPLARGAALWGRVSKPFIFAVLSGVEWITWGIAWVLMVIVYGLAVAGGVFADVSEWCTNWRRRRRCAHDFRFAFNYHGDAVFLSGGHLSAWKCVKCGTWQGRDQRYGPEVEWWQ